MMECGDCGALLDSWEDGAELGPDALGLLVAHIGECPRCGEDRAPLLPLLERDLCAARRLPAEIAPSAAARGLADSVMAAIGSGAAAPRRPSPRHSTPRRPSPRRVPALPPSAARAGRQSRRGSVVAVAVAALLALGLGLGSYFGLRDPDTVTVHFVLADPGARSVALAGDFTGWKGRGLELRRVGSDGTWGITLKLRKGGLYAYNFIVDGQRWIPDPSVPERVDDGFGGSSSLLRL
ncbi:MAG: isoamylase early set domain-containing protein [Treponema sp.]|nr:isoamylase early set domain-containing protein [Treponema sp.]